MLCGLASGLAGAAEADAPWRLGRSLGFAEWFSLEGAYRVRYEYLDGPFRAGATGSDEVAVERLLLAARFTFDQFYGGIELEDARQQLADSGTPLGTDIVNTFEPLQVYVGARFGDEGSKGSHVDVSAGRMTVDLGSRRLVARNRFRNTLNAFTGLRAIWQGAAKSEVQAFYVLPVQRKPSDFDSLEANDTDLDITTSDAQLWGFWGAHPNVFGKATGEAYFYGLRTRDHPDIPVADRDLYTPGFRLYVKPAAKQWDFDVEAAYQFGTSRLSTSATDTEDLQHSAGFFHGAVGYTLASKTSTRLELSYDYASGDHDPNDGDNNRFDTLYGARRFDFGPTGIYGAIARSNINTPGMRIEMKPSRDLNWFAGYHAVWLASSKDQFTSGRLQDRTGQSGSFIGHQIEAMLQYTLLPGSLALEFGGAYLIHGEFLEKAPNAPQEGDTKYVYASITATF